MLDVIPRFIHDMVVNRIRKGQIEATTVFIDISGFTPMSEKLYRFGKEGSEVLSEVLNNTFQPIVKEIHSFGGFVASFPGDAISAIFPSKQMDELEPLVEMIQNQFTRKPGSTRFGTFSITVRIGVSQGLVSWGIVGKARRKAFFFRGKALVDSAGATAACAPGETVFVQNSSIQELSTGDSYSACKKDVNESVEISARIAGFFTHRRVLGIGELNGEFREVVPVFISFREVNSFQELNEFTSMLLNSAAGFGGYFNGLFFDDKGATVLVLFGAPVAYENNIERAIEFILSVREDTRWDVSAGITKGIAFTGALGSKLRHTYTAIGDVVNTAARLAGKASWNQILLSAEVLRGLDIEYQTIALEPLLLKGKKKAVGVFELAGGRRGVSRNFISDKFVGRYHELKSAAEFIELTLENNTGVVLYAYGDLGTGKSRYLFELSEKLSNSFRTIILKTDDVLRKSLNPFTSYLRKFFNQGDSRTRTENKVVFEEVWEELIEDLLEIEDTAASDLVVESLENLHSVIGAMLGFHWGGSFYETLDAVGRFENTLSAVKDIFIAFSLLHPTIIIIEDLQWLDSDSSKAFEVILRSLKDYPLIVMASSRFKDDGSKPILDVEESVPCMEITLDSLADEFSLELITNLIRNPLEDELSKFIISRAQGNPFYLEQFCLYLLENNIIRHASGIASMVRMDSEIPAGIKTVIIARLDRLPEDLRELIHSASVLGQEFDSEILSEMRNSIDTQTLLSAGERELIWTSSPADSLYSFRHPLLRDASYDMQLRGDLRKLHMKATEAILDLFPEDMDQYINLAYHYEKADMLKEAIHYYELAADHSRKNYRNHEAMEMYDKLNHFYFWTEKVLITSGTAIFESISAPGFKDFPVRELLLRYIKILSNQALVQQVSGKWDRAEKTFRTILKLAERIESESATAEALYLLGKQLSRKGKNNEALENLTLALSLFSKIDDNNGITKIWGSIGVVHWSMGDFDKAMEYYGKQLELSRGESNLRQTSIAYSNMGIIEFTRGKHAVAKEYFKSYLNISIELGDLREEAKALGSLGIAYSSEGNYLKTMECLEKELIIERKLGHKAGISVTIGNMGIVFVRQGEYKKAMKCYREHLKLVEELGDRSAIAKVLWNIGLLQMYTGQYKYTEYFFTRSISIDEKLGKTSIIASHITKLGNLYKVLNLHEKAEECYNKSIRLISRTEQREELCKCLFEKADLYFRQKKFEDSKRLNAAAYKIAEEIGNDELEFRSELLKELILAQTESDQAARNLKKILVLCEEDEQRAQLLFEIYLIQKSREYGESALKVLRHLYNLEPLHSYLEKINLLEGELLK